MSYKTKKIGMWSLKAVAVGLFVVLMLVNVQAVIGDGTVAGVDISSIKFDAFINASNAEFNNGYIWKVTCKYNGSGTLTEKICESSSNLMCSCPR